MVSVVEFSAVAFEGGEIRFCPNLNDHNNWKNCVVNMIYFKVFDSIKYLAGEFLWKINHKCAFHEFGSTFFKLCKVWIL